MTLYNVRLTNKETGEVHSVQLKEGEKLPFGAEYCEKPMWPYSTSNGPKWKIENLGVA